MVGPKAKGASAPLRVTPAPLSAAAAARAAAAAAAASAARCWARTWAIWPMIDWRWSTS